LILRGACFVAPGGRLIVAKKHSSVKKAQTERSDAVTFNANTSLRMLELTQGGDVVLPKDPHWRTNGIIY